MTDKYGNERRGKMRYKRSYSSTLADEIEGFHQANDLKSIQREADRLDRIAKRLAKRKGQSLD